MADDAGKKVDQPSAEAGKGPDPKVEQEAAEAKAAEATEAAEAATEDTPKPAKKKATAAKAKAKKAPAAKAKAKKAPAAKAKAAAKPDEEPKAEEKPKEEPKPAPAARRKRSERELVTVQAKAKFVRTSARKARLIADHVRGKDVNEAMSILAFSPRSVAEDWTKVLKSAVANAEHNHDLVGDDLRILNATADEGPTLKRYRPRAMGRATRIRKRTSHLTITLTPKD